MPPASVESPTVVRRRGDRTAERSLAPYVLLDDSLSPDGPGYLFEDPVEIVRCERPDEVGPALERLAQAPARGLHAAGFLAYELGYLLEPKLAGLIPGDREQPLIWMGLFACRRTLDGAVLRRFFHTRAQSGHEVGGLRPSISRDAYLAAMARVKDYIAAGDVYQINLTFKYLFDFSGDPLSLYAELRRKQRVAYGGMIRTPEADVLSLSPELFIATTDDRVVAKPMKGTAARQPTPAADERERAWLRGDAKSRAENLMIVDLLRNDLGRVATIGSVEVPELFTVETYTTVHQMTSTVRARLRHGVGVRDLVCNLFPCGSITGAPKVRAMEIIRELEPLARGVYTGAIGMIAPSGEVSFNVAIRTLVLDRDGRGEMGIGSGIVHDSDPEAEFEECLLKARFLTDPFRPFQLIETLRWTRSEGYALLDEHMARLTASAAHFAFRCEAAAIRRALEDRTADLTEDVMRVRLLLDEDGGIEITVAPLALPGLDTVVRYAISEHPIDRDDPFFYHKTTCRDFYDGELTRLRAETGCDEVLFVNDRGELTEGSRTNLFIEREGRLLTPPVSCGLLDGTLRRSLVADPATEIEERILTPADLAAAERVFLGNSVRGLVPARPVD